MGKKESSMESLVKSEVDPNFWKNKKVFLTGHTGFKGSWLALMLNYLGAKVKGYALAPENDPNLFVEAQVGSIMESQIGDIRDMDSLSASINNFGPDILLHLAAQPLVRLSYKMPLDTYEINVMGTANVLEAALKCNKLKAVVAVTSDKCYENRECLWGYRENDSMGGGDPYSSSKGCAELVISSYRQSFYCHAEKFLASARAGNVIGGGDWSLDRLLPDSLKAFSNNDTVLIRNPHAIRPWQHVIEPISGYLLLAEKLYTQGKKYSEAWNFGPKDGDAKSVEWVINYLKQKWGQEAHWTIDGELNPHEAKILKLDCSKATSLLGWSPKWDIYDALNSTVDWYKGWLSGDKMQDYCLMEIKKYLNYERG